MNKTVTINISGIIFHIEEDAYETLSRYLQTIRGYFKDSDGRDEIMADIEARIAEMLSQKVNKGRQVVLMSDVDEVISIMGRPEDYAAEAGSFEEQADADSQSAYVKPKRRRVFRDGENAMLGGVCSGISNYFDLDPVWLRIAWAISFFAFGFGLLLYILLWIIIPEAKTTSEKLEMRGETVNINNIKRSMADEAEEVKKRASKFAENVNTTKIKETTTRAGNFLSDIITNTLKVAGKIFLWLLAFISVILLIVLLSALFGADVISNININGVYRHYDIHEASNLIFDNVNHKTWAIIGLAMFLGMPLIMLLYGVLRGILGIKNENRIIKWTANSIWIIGLLICLNIVFLVKKSFKIEDHYKTTSVLQPLKNDTLYVSVEASHASKKYEEDSYKAGYFNIGKDSIYSNDFLVDIVESSDSTYKIMLVKRSKGSSIKEAAERAKVLNYQFQQKDSAVVLGNYFSYPAVSKFRGQELIVVICVPKNKVVYLSPNLRDNVIGADIKNIKDVYDGDMPGHYWIMREEGLDCLNCDEVYPKKGKRIHKHGKDIEMEIRDEEHVY